MQLAILLLSIGWIGYVLTTDPRNGCGPFRFAYTYGEPFTLALDDLSNDPAWGWFGVIVKILTNPWTIYTINIGLLSACYVAWQFTRAHKKNVKRLKNQLEDLYHHKNMAKMR